MKKRFFITIIVMLMTILTSFAYDFEVDGIRYNVISFTEFKAETTASPNLIIDEDGVIEIPNEINYNGRTLNVIRIGDNSFTDSRITTVFLNENIISIGKYAFANCSMLNNITASNVVNIENNAFEGCAQLNNVSLGENVENIGSSAFRKCFALDKFQENTSLLNIGEYAFAESGIKYFVLNENMTVGQYAFKGCENLEEVEFQSMPFTIPIGLFKDCTSLSILTNFNTPENINDYTFYNCESLNVKSIIESPILKNIGSYAFANCIFPSELKLHSSITSLGSYVFVGFEGNFYIEDSTTILQNNDNAFGNMIIKKLRLGRDLSSWQFSFPSSLEELKIGSKVTAIAPPVQVTYGSGTTYGGAPFIHCSNLKTLEIEESENTLIISGIGNQIGYEHKGGDYKDWYYDYYYSGIFSECPISTLKLERPIDCVTYMSNGHKHSDRYYTYDSYRAEDPFSNVRTIENLTIDYDNFKLCPNRVSLKNLNIGYNVTIIPALENCDLSNISVRNGIPPKADNFSSATYLNCVLRVPTTTIQIYKDTAPWENFWQIEESEDLFDPITELNIISSFQMKIGKERTLIPTIYPTYATNKKLIWESSNESIVSCTEDGHIKALSLGTVEIKIVTSDGSDLCAICNISVIEEVGFVNIYSTVTYNDMSVSTTGDYFNYIPEITGPYNEDDFWMELWVLDKDNKFDQHVITISGGDYAGNYINTNADREMWSGKYIFNLISKGTNPNVVANPSRAYVTVNRASTNLEWNVSSPIRVKVGEKVDLGISYQADLWCTFNTDYDKELISLSSEGATTRNPHWYATGLKEGRTYLYFSIECKKNDFGFYDFRDSSTLYKEIIVSGYYEDGIEEVPTESDGTMIVYNLQGMRMNVSTRDELRSLEPGLYIINGKKEIIR